MHDFAEKNDLSAMPSVFKKSVYVSIRTVFPCSFSRGLAAIAPALNFGSSGPQTSSASVGFLLTASEGFHITPGL